jgi:hypothetical protein
MKKLVVIITICLMSISSYCQTPGVKQDSVVKDIRKNSIFFELGGNGLLYSVNYERLIDIAEDLVIGLRIGYSYCNMSFAIMEKYSIVPLEINLISGKKHCFELGCGLTVSKRTIGKAAGSYSEPVETSERIQTLVFRTGYRYRADSGFLFRFAPMFMINDPIQLFGNNGILGLGMSVGCSF